MARAYSTGDFFHGFSTSWEYTVDNSYVLSDITVDIRLPDGRPAALDENSAVIFKVTKAKAMPALLPTATVHKDERTKHPPNK